MTCPNSKCPIHGETPEAKENRETQDKILKNEELMGVIRIIAANVNACCIAASGNQPDVVDKLLMHAMLEGDLDQHPYVQGTLSGLTVLLKGHRPTQEYFVMCSYVEKNNLFIEKMKKQSERGEGPEIPPEILKLLRTHFGKL